MNDEIKFYIPDDEVIPTQLRLRVDGVDVYYEKLKEPGCIAYQFEFFRFQISEEKGREIVDRIAHIMEGQSYDHGASWRIISITPAHTALGLRYVVRFRLRDAG